MQIALLTAGTRGDVQPFLALGWALRARGHEVAIAVPSNFVGLAEACGLRAFDLGLNAEAMFREDLGRRALLDGRFVSFARMLLAADVAADDIANSATEATIAGADVVVSNLLTLERAKAVAARDRIPMAAVTAAPLAPTRAFASPLLPVPSLGFGWLNRAVSDALTQFVYLQVRSRINRFRARLGLGPMPVHAMRAGAPRHEMVLHAWSAAVCPRPDDWGPWHHVTGFWHAPPELRPILGESGVPSAVEGFDTPPVYVGFGSMPVQDPRRMLDDVATAASRALVRVLLCAGWSELPEGHHGDVLVVRALDHGAVLPRCSGAVHHGGAGTIAASLGAGLPTWVCAVFGDQPWWGRRCAALGVGGWSWLRSMRSERFYEAFCRIGEASVRDRARALGQRLREDDGIGRTVALVEDVLPRQAAPT